MIFASRRTNLPCLLFSFSSQRLKPPFPSIELRRGDSSSLRRQVFSQKDQRAMQKAIALRRQSRSFARPPRRTRPRRNTPPLARDADQDRGEGVSRLRRASSLRLSALSLIFRLSASVGGRSNRGVRYLFSFAAATRASTACDADEQTLPLARQRPASQFPAVEASMNTEF